MKTVSPDNVLETLREDRAKRTRFPVRCILVDSPASWKVLFQKLRFELTQTITLSLWCADASLPPKLGHLKDHLMKLEGFEDAKGKQAPLVWLASLGECVRLSGEVQLLRSILTLDRYAYGRILVPIIADLDWFNAMAHVIDRQRVGELPEPWCFRSSPVLGKRMDILASPLRQPLRPNAYQVNSVVEYLRLWEEGRVPEQHIQLLTELPLEKLERSLPLLVVPTAWHALEDAIPGVKGVAEDRGSASQWCWLHENAKLGESLRDLTVRLLGLPLFDGRVSALALTKNWIEITENLRWIAQLSSGGGLLDSDYAERALATAATPELFPTRLARLLLELPPAEATLERLAERRALLEPLQDRVNWTGFIDDVKAEPKPLRRLQLFTGLRFEERVAMVGAVAELLKSGVGREQWEPLVRLTWPALAWHMEPPQLGNAFLERYFSEFTRARILNEPTPVLLSMGKQAAREETAWGVQPREQLLLKARALGEVRWMDGMGLEWAGFIAAAVNELSQGEVVAIVQPARASLPSITATNNHWGDDDFIARDLDQLGHDYDYAFHTFFTRTLDAMELFIRKALERMQEVEAVILTGDHGLTPATFNKDTVVPPSGSTPHKWGRCAAIVGNVPDSDDITTEGLVREGEHFIMAMHGRFQGGGASRGLVHGGATLEEWLVPVVTLMRERAESIRLLECDDVVRLDASGRGHLRVVVRPAPPRLTLRLGDVVYHAEATPEGGFIFEVTDLPSGAQEVQFFHGPRLLERRAVTIFKGLQEDDLGI